LWCESSNLQNGSSKTLEVKTIWPTNQWFNDQSMRANTNQGCQVFLGTKYQNAKKYTKLPRTIPIVHTK
jgi:hypothetical protein